MIETVTRNWWLAVLRGVVAVVFGTICLIWPGLGLATLVLLFGAFAFIDGVFAGWAAFTMRRRHATWLPLMLEGVTGIVLGILVFRWPDMTAIALVLFIAAWAIVTGVLEIAAAVRLRKDIEGEWALGLMGLLSIAFGVLVAIWPGAGLLAVVVIVGVYAIFFGVALIAFGLRLRKAHGETAKA